MLMMLSCLFLQEVKGAGAGLTAAALIAMVSYRAGTFNSTTYGSGKHKGLSVPFFCFCL